MKEFLTLDDVEVEKKTVIVRVDINSPLDKNGKIIDNERIRAHAKTLKELSEKNAKVVVLAHQGRKGESNFISLNQHAELLSSHIGKEVKFIDDIIGKKAIESIKNLKEGEILLLDNVRFLDEETEKKSAEEHAKSKLVQTLSPLANIFVQDAFSASHRAHASIIGFSKVLPVVAGRVMERELTSIKKFFDPLGIHVFILGGAKPEDCLDIMEYMFNNKPEIVERVLTCGTIGEIFLVAQGYKLGRQTIEFFAKKGFLDLIPRARKLLEKYGMEIKVPIDIAFEADGERKEISIKKLPVDPLLLDIGSETMDIYSKIIREAQRIVMKGPAGIYEKNGFEIGTKTILEEVAESKAFTLIGGGDLGIAIEKLGIDKNMFSYISLGGGALITYLAGKPMPGIEILKVEEK